MHCPRQSYTLDRAQARPAADNRCASTALPMYLALEQTESRRTGLPSRCSGVRPMPVPSEEWNDDCQLLCGTRRGHGAHGVLCCAPTYAVWTAATSLMNVDETGYELRRRPRATDTQDMRHIHQPSTHRNHSRWYVSGLRPGLMNVIQTPSMSGFDDQL